MTDLKDLKFEKMIISDQAFEKLQEIINTPSQPTQALIDLMKRHKPWATEEKETKNA